MKPIEAVVTRKIYSLTEGQKVKILGFSSTSWSGFGGDKGMSASCVVVAEDGTLHSASLGALKVDYQTV